MNELENLTTLVRAKTPLLVIETFDEQRVNDCFRHVISQSLRPLWRWTLTDALSRLDFGQRDTNVGRTPAPRSRRSVTNRSRASI